jgi:hypothetical protein
MTTSGNAIFDESLQCLWAHCHPQHGDRIPLDVFNRLLAKNIKPTGWTANIHLNIQPQQISSRREKWTTDALANLPRGHGSTKGEDFDCPIVVAEYEGKQRLLDGNHRINRWIVARDTAPHDVNIHTIVGIGQFVVLPTISGA